MCRKQGRPAKVINKGNVPNIPEYIEQLPGASRDTKVVHIAIINYKGKST